MAMASNAKKKYSHKAWTEGVNVGSVSCQRHRAYIISNEPAVDPNKIRSRACKGSSSRPITSNPSSSPRSIDRMDELSAALSNITPRFYRLMESTPAPPAVHGRSLRDGDV